MLDLPPIVATAITFLLLGILAVIVAWYARHWPEDDS